MEIPHPRRRPWWQQRYSLSLLLLLLAVILIAWGIFRGDPSETRRNAHYLCLECIGIG